ncbi:zinc finger protein, predicted [Trypanosoma grayi]|uniref:zinc finger protein, predicted n=1 Tax=Trypanosoma grayi TaxID=71804 RepID=UPI0004F45233|nr:zinc finger protein, predicted [Trypanosoma grayi]KEG12120.1 zinc finger protein, predicted [Trypanosoma grayi]
MSTPRRRLLRSPDSVEAPLLRRRICRESSPSGDGIGNGERRGGLSPTEWQQLYERVLPNPFSMDDFQRVALEGKLHDHFLAKDLHKLVMELRTILESHGELRMAANLSVKGRKTDLAHAAAAALKLLESERRRLLSEDLLAAGTDERELSPRVMLPALPERPVTTPAGQPASLILSTGCMGSLRSPQPLTPCPTVRLMTSNQVDLDNGFAASSLTPKSLTSVREAADELILMNNSSSPFSRVLHMVKRFQLRFGSIPLRFEVPVQYVDAVASRRLRVQLAPFRHPALPSRWPTAKDIVVYVNDQCVMTPWKRSWPERRVEVAKSFLPLDITQFLNRSSASQRLQINIFSREYFSQVALMIVQPASPEEVTSELVRPLNNPPEARDAAIYELYQSVTEDEDALSGEVELCDPVVTSKCPILQTRIDVPIRGTRCRHLQCFDCQSFLLSCHKGCYWNCPLCDAELRPSDVVVDTVLWRYLQEAGESCPLHLRLLSKRSVEKREKMKKEKEEDLDAGNGEVTEPFRWVPNQLTGGVHDVVLDDDNDEAGVGQEHYLCGSRLSGKGDHVVGEGIHAAASFDKQLGTAECPIEL